MEVALLRGRQALGDKAVQEVRDEKDVFKKMKEQIQGKFNDTMA
jgi:predicted nuclease with TOPRIM domain